MQKSKSKIKHIGKVSKSSSGKENKSGVDRLLNSVKPAYTTDFNTWPDEVYVLCKDTVTTDYGQTVIIYVPTDPVQTLWSYLTNTFRFQFNISLRESINRMNVYLDRLSHVYSDMLKLGIKLSSSSPEDQALLWNVTWATFGYRVDQCPNALKIANRLREYKLPQEELPRKFKTIPKKKSKK